VTITPSHFWYQTAYEQILDALPRSTPTVWVEVGVLAGASTVWLGQEILTRGLKVTLHCVDTFEGWDETPQGDALRALFDANTREMAAALGDRFKVHAMTSIAAAQTFPVHSADVVWIDADHRYAAVCADIASWLPRVKTGGVLGGDDYALDGVKLAVRDAGLPVTVGQGERHGEPWPWWMVRC
jgi:predicted O-methyltransferase YrrM